jgi:hypothetical protein
VITWRDEGWNGVRAFKLATQELSCIRRDAVVLEEIATTANYVDALVDGQLDASSQRIAQGLASSAGHIRLRPRKGRIQVHV